MSHDDIRKTSWSSGSASWSILVHGGAGDVPRERLPLHVAGCEVAVSAAAAILEAGGSALDAVQRAVEILEADPLFNAGTGACLNSEGHIELDAAIMDGETLRAGGVCALPPFEHPIAIARCVMEKSRHVLLAAEGAARFAIEQGFVRADEEAMITELARRRLAAVRTKNATEGWAGGTVGAVARDVRGHVAAATSTGGMVNKLPGRVGDSPIVGAGTYADDARGACSTTGHGEAMMRVCAAKTAVDALPNVSDPGSVSSRDDTSSGKGAGKNNLEAAAEAAVAALGRMLDKTNERGGAIVVAHNGALGMARTTPMMSWAAAANGGLRSSGG